MARPAIFLDRDGTLNFDSGYTHKIPDWQWLPGSLAGLNSLITAGWLPVAVSNQSGISRGYYDFAQLKELEKWVNEELARHGIRMGGWYYCPHGPDDNCDCRKPKPGLILKAAHELDLDLAHSWMIGDRASDIAAGIAAGCKTALIRNPRYPEEEELARKIAPGLKVGDNLEELAREIGQPC